MADLESLIAAELDRFEIPGAAVAVLRGEEVLLQKGFGVRNLDQKAPVTEQTLFPIGSTTKAFTAAVLGTFVDAGVIGWDQPVREYFPDFRLSDSEATERVTLRDMLSHRTGMARHDLLMLMYAGGQMSRPELVSRLRYLEMNKGLGEEFQYNNLIYTAAGYLTEVLEGITWEQAVSERLLQPLGMTNSNLSLIETEKSPDHSRPHAEKDGRVVEIPFRSIEIAGPAGSINSCIADMTHWLRLNLQIGAATGAIVSPASLKEIHSPAISLPPEASPWDEIDLQGYALGWLVEEYRGHRHIWHNGGIDGFKSVVAFLPREKLGVVVLANRFPTEGPEAIAYRVFDELLGLEPVPWGERFRDLEATLASEAETALGQKGSARKTKPPSHPVADYAGSYSHPGYGRITFDVVDDELVADWHGLQVTLTHRHYDIWEAREVAHDIEIPVLFRMDAMGEIDQVDVELEPAVDPIVFKRDRETDAAG